MDYKAKRKEIAGHFYNEMLKLSHEQIDSEKTLELFEQKAELFYSRYGMLAPGKSDPMDDGRNSELKRALWDAWLQKAALDDAVNEIIRLRGIYESEN